LLDSRIFEAPVELDSEKPELTSAKKGIITELIDIIY